MHYYQFNIGDYTKKTKHLTPLEDIAYRRMLDLFYDSEDPLPCEISRIARLIVMPENQEEIRQVLNEFWTETDAGWVDNRAEREIESYHRKAESARVNGKKGGRPKTQKKPKKTQPVNLANPTETESKANHKPLTINQELLKESDRSADQSHAQLVEKAYDYIWKVFKQCKKDIGKVDTSPQSRTFEKKWKPMFNSAYFKKHTEQEFKDEINRMAEFIQEAHKLEGFNRFENMQLPKLLTEKQWRDE